MNILKIKNVYPKYYRGIIILLTGLILLPGCKKAAVPPSDTCSYTADPAYAKHPKAAQLNQLIQKYVKKGLPGISIYVQDSGGTFVGSYGQADINKNIAMTPCMVSKAASVTKMFVGTLAMKLFEQGKANIDDKASAYLPAEVVSNVKNLKDVTLKQLMNHTTGIYDIISDNNFYLEVLNNPDQLWDAASLIKYAYNKTPVFAAGDSCEYSNTNYLLLAMCLDKILGYSHAIALRNMVLNPLNLSSTYYYRNEALPLNVAQGYFDLYNNGTIVNVSNYNTGSGNGYGGIYSTVMDMATFVNALLREQTLVSASSLATMKTVVKEEDSLYLGPGLMRRYVQFGKKRTGYGHTGRDLGYDAAAFYFPAYNATITYMVNYGTNGTSALKQVFLDFEKDLLYTVMP